MRLLLIIVLIFAGFSMYGQKVHISGFVTANSNYPQIIPGGELSISIRPRRFNTDVMIGYRYQEWKNIVVLGFCEEWKMWRFGIKMCVPLTNSELSYPFGVSADVSRRVIKRVALRVDMGHLGNGVYINFGTTVKLFE